MSEQQQELLDAAKAVLARWDTPQWKDVPNTAEYINRLRAAIARCEALPDEVLREHLRRHGM